MSEIEQVAVDTLLCIVSPANIGVTESGLDECRVLACTHGYNVCPSQESCGTDLGNRSWEPSV